MQATNIARAMRSLRNVCPAAMFAFMTRADLALAVALTAALAGAGCAGAREAADDHVATSQPNGRGATQHEHDAEPTEHDAEPTEHDAEPTEHDAEPTEHDAEPTEHDAEPTENDAAPEDGEVSDPMLPPPPDVEEGSAPQAWQSCQRDDECTVRSLGCCSPCNLGGYVPMRVDHAKTLAASCRREPVACPACAAPVPPPVVCAAGFCTLE